MSGQPVSRDQLRKIRDHRVKLCQNALLKDGNTACLFAGIMEQEESGSEFAVSLGKNGHVVICGITVDKMILFGKRQKHTTLLHLLCQSRMQLLLFLLKRYQKKSRAVSNGIFQSSSDERYDVVATFLMNNFNDLAYVKDDDCMTPLDRLVQYFGDSEDCLQPLQDVFKLLVDAGDILEEGCSSHLVKSVLQKICQIKLLPRKCGESCVCVKNVFQTLWYTNRETVETHSFQCAATNGNFAVMQLLLLSLQSLHVVTTEIASTETGTSEPVVVYLVKLMWKRDKKYENDVIKIIELLAKRNDVNINKPDSDGLNAIFYSALYKLRKTFHFLLRHPTYQPDWRNERNESLEDLFLWSDMLKSNPAALIAIRRVAEPPRVLTGPSFTGSSSEWSSKSELPELLSQNSRNAEMDEGAFKKKILDNFPQLCNDMDPDGNCLDILVQRGVFPWSNIDGLMNEKSRHNKARKVLTLVLRSGQKGQAALLEALRKSHQEHLASLLSFERSPSYQSLPPSDCSSRLLHETSTEDNTIPKIIMGNLAAAHELSFEEATYNTSFTSFAEGNPDTSWEDSPPKLEVDGSKSTGPATVVSV